MRAFACVLFAWLLASPSMADPALGDIDAIAALTVGHETPGLALLVTENGKILLARGYGYADLEKKIPVTPETVFDLASVSKQMTALLAFKLARAGKIDLAAPLERALPGFRQHDGARAITPNDLIHHMAGFPDYLEAYEPQQSDADVLAYANEQPLHFEPGTQFEYCNTCYVLLAEALSHVAGAADFGALLEADVFKPLAMMSSAAPLPRAGLEEGRIAKGYRAMEGQFEASHDEGLTFGDGSIFASIDDLARYEASFFSGALLGKNETDALFTPGRLDDGRVAGESEGEAYAYGWFVSSESGHRLAFHSGSWSGTATCYERDLDTGLSVIVLENGEDGDPGDIAEMVREAYERE